MSIPSEGETNGIEINSDRRSFMKVAAVAGLAGAAAIAPQLAEAQQPEVKDPVAPPALKPAMKRTSPSSILSRATSTTKTPKAKNAPAGNDW